VVGGDFPKEYLIMLNDRGVKTEGVQSREEEKSFFWQGKYHLDMNLRDTIVTELNVLATFDPGICASCSSNRYVKYSRKAVSTRSMRAPSQSP
jgi:hypothetical protein